ncbi:hypothetical protein AGOR_G00093650 [Albula goreensis]|uniref:VWFA domain-containing protein n=1 Tax=Albula goreensis TaxID=1534307 RepID=A0A8T3DMY3_9TELE|nr:hypothetical protein AGOR_G00093650 [Albula goreensis]
MNRVVILTLYLCTVFQPADPFNVDTAAWKSFSSSATEFGYRVIQTTTESVLVSAPLTYNQNNIGSVYNCLVGSSTCSEISIPVPSHAVNLSLGLSMAKDPKSSKTVVCGPTISRQCTFITTYNGMCFQLNEQFQEVPGSGLPPTLRDCPGGTDIVFLMDGSGSVAPLDFAKMKTFVLNLIEKLLGRNSLFAVMQYSSRFNVVFDFKDFQRNSHDWRNKINSIIQQQGGTQTGTAILKVVNELFGPSHGHRPKVNKVLVVITDGESQDSNTLKSAIQLAANTGIIRYAIGVGNAFRPYSQGRLELELIASKPTVKHMFQVNNFQALDNLKETLEKNIFAIEGTQTSGQSFEMELAQEGFSTSLLPSGEILMGAVGSFDWNGGYQKFQTGTATPNPSVFPSSKTDSDSYLGYSMAVAETNRQTYIIVGAPRYQHAGRVVVFHRDVKMKELESEQIGSYFGAEVCTVDLNSDSKTDLLLISAPMYIDKQTNSEGKVYVCIFQSRPGVACSNVALVGMPGVKGRFGASLSALADLTGDGISEVAVGAPLENNGQGSVYIFSGMTGGVTPTYSQRIESSTAQSGLRYFGQSVSGSLDQSGDRLTDIAVGSKGKVLLFRSRPVVSVDAMVSFSPSKIPVIECGKTTPITANVCFSMQRRTKDTIGDLKARVAYTLKLDATRSHFRAYFIATNRTLDKDITLTLSKQCDNIGFFIADCPEDALNPLSNELKFSFEGLPSNEPASQGLSPILHPKSPTTAYYPLDFEIDCGPDNTCIDDLKVDFNFSGASEVKLGIALVLNVTVTVENRGENSYNTHVLFTYPEGLSYRRVTVVQEPTSRATVQCDSEDGTSMPKSACYVNKPIFKSNGRVIFIISFGIDANSHFGQTVTFTANATSGNERHITKENFKTAKIGVKYNIYVLIKGLEETTSYINFTAGKNDVKKSVLHSYEVVNYIRDLDASVIFRVPIKLGDKNIWSNVSSIQIPGCLTETDEKPNVTNFVEKLEKNPTVDCTVSVCRVIRCNEYFRKDYKYSYNISGEVSSAWIEQTELISLTLVSKAVLDYDQKQYIFTSSSSQNSPPVTEVATRVEVFSEADFTVHIIGSAVGGLLLLALITAGLYKAGFFKSQYQSMMESAGEADGGTGAEDGAAPAQ